MITRMLFDMPVPPPTRPKTKPTPDGAHQRLLLDGLDCLPGQQDLFDEPKSWTSLFDEPPQQPAKRLRRHSPILPDEDELDAIYDEAKKSGPSLQCF